MQIAFLTDKGKIRELNEDSLFVDEDIGLFIVADGMGGHQAGEVASEMAVKIIADSIKKNLSDNNMSSLIKESISKANNEILLESRKNTNLSGMGTTVVLAMLNDNKLHIANVGDSRAYLIKNNRIKQLTEDHSKVAELVRWGAITKEEARVYPGRNIITKALGTTESVEADIKTISMKTGDYILLCTDGLTDVLKDEEIRDIIIISSNGSIDEKCKKLINQANEKGGGDNVTAVLINIMEATRWD